MWQQVLYLVRELSDQHATQEISRKSSQEGLPVIFESWTVMKRSTFGRIGVKTQMTQTGRELQCPGWQRLASYAHSRDESESLGHFTPHIYSPFRDQSETLFLITLLSQASLQFCRRSHLKELTNCKHPAHFCHYTRRIQRVALQTLELWSQNLLLAFGLNRNTLWASPGWNRIAALGCWREAQWL